MSSNGSRVASAGAARWVCEALRPFAPFSYFRPLPCFLFALLTLFLVRKPRKGYPRGALPYTTLLHTVPLLTVLTFVSAAVAYAHMFLLRVFVRPVMVATSVFIPATLFVSALWAFIGSFMWDGDKEPTWGETVG